MPVFEVILTCIACFTIILFLLKVFGEKVVTSVQKTESPKVPPHWDVLLKENVGYYHGLSAEKQNRFKVRVHQFLQEKPILSQGLKVTDVQRVLVASSAVSLTLAFDQWSFNYLRSVTLVSGAVSTCKQNKGFVLGLVSSLGSRCEMVLSVQALEQGFRDLKDKRNVGIHEFVHVLYHGDGDMDGIPKAIMPPELIDPWLKMMKKKIREIRRRSSDINPYGGTNEAEFLAVICEYFFERPKALELKHPALYDLLVKTFRQEPSGIRNRASSGWRGGVEQKTSRNAKCPCGSGQKYKRCCLS